MAERHKTPCKRCVWWRGVPASYRTWMSGIGVFNVDTAELIILKRPRPYIVIPHKDIWRYVQPDQTDAEHIPHVDPRKPGIIAQVSHVRGLCRVLIEGRHRAAQCLYSGKDFKAYLLTRTETEYTLLKRMAAPGKARRKDNDKKGEGRMEGRRAKGKKLR